MQTVAAGNHHDPVQLLIAGFTTLFQKGGGAGEYRFAQRIEAQFHPRRRHQQQLVERIALILDVDQQEKSALDAQRIHPGRDHLSTQAVGHRVREVDLDGLQGGVNSWILGQQGRPNLQELARRRRGDRASRGRFVRFAPWLPVTSGHLLGNDIPLLRLDADLVVCRFRDFGSVRLEIVQQGVEGVPGSRLELDPGSRRRIGVPLDGGQVAAAPQLDQVGSQLHLRLKPLPDQLHVSHIGGNVGWVFVLAGAPVLEAKEAGFDRLEIEVVEVNQAAGGGALRQAAAFHHAFPFQRSVDFTRAVREIDREPPEGSRRALRPGNSGSSVFPLSRSRIRGRRRGRRETRRRAARKRRG